MKLIKVTTNLGYRWMNPRHVVDVTPPADHIIRRGGDIFMTFHFVNNSELDVMFTSFEEAEKFVEGLDV